MSRPQLIQVARCIYREDGTKKFFHSIRLPGKDHPTKRKLAATTLKAAIAELETLNTRRREARIGIGIDPLQELVTVGALAARWKAGGCPDRKGLSRTGSSLDAESDRLERLLPFWSSRAVSEIVAFEDCGDYHAWRVKHRRSEQFRLGRSVDAELTTLSNLLEWAARNPRKTGVKHNPISSRPRFDNPKLVRHCTAVMPRTDEEFHARAAFLLSSTVSQPLGWQYLLEGLTGCRTSEILACRLDARQLTNDDGEPGYFDSHKLHIIRCKAGINAFALMEATPGHDPLRDCMQAFLNWHEKEYPESHWYIPGGKSKQPMTRCALNNALERASTVLGLDKVTSHGQRAYFVHTLRAMGVPDNEIAARLGHRSTQMIEQTYGRVKAGWFGSWQQDFLPEDSAPAWAAWRPKVAYQKLIPTEPKNRIGSKQTGNQSRAISP